MPASLAALNNVPPLVIRPSRWFSTLAFVVSTGFLCGVLFFPAILAIVLDRWPSAFLVAAASAFLLDVTSLVFLFVEYRQTQRAFRETDCELASVFDNVLDGVLVVDANGNCLDVNDAAAKILRVSRNQLVGNNVSTFFRQSIHFFGRWRSHVQENHRDRIVLVAGDGATIPVDCTITADYVPGRRLCIFCDVTEESHTTFDRVGEERSRCSATARNANQFDATEIARAEAEVLRKASFALSRGVAMDSMFDALFECFANLVPFHAAVILLREGEEELMVAREAPNGRSKRVGMFVKASSSGYLQRILFEQRPVLIPDTSRESPWRPVVPQDRARSWIGLPLVSRGCVVGVLSLSSRTAGRFTPEHLRLAKSLAVSAALAIDHARVRESAEIYAASLRLRFRDPS